MLALIARTILEESQILKPLLASRWHSSPDINNCYEELFEVHKITKVGHANDFSANFDSLLLSLSAAASYN